ncbi:DUF2269 family protein [Azospirillum thermophilum]|uniref:DUF2269 domain-containing protein n=1 Tax=Azospirillum thermophilum TaxID=2202148 RepID=A0A2S2CM40_9PROT|nr:DUF2269 family protein [Azospirillum thermophilum]AWK85564.1 DUF2269 domain-containing protein [Azospirillum thermophilum]
MQYGLLKFAHLAGLLMIGAGLIGVFVADLRARQSRDLPVFAEAVRLIGVFYDGLVVPGALTLLASGVWLIVIYYDGLAFLDEPWLAGMVLLFLIEFVEGNTVTRLYFTRLQRLTRIAVAEGRFTPELVAARDRPAATFTHFLDLPLLMLIVSLGAIRPADWTVFAVGGIAALAVAAALTVTLPRLYPADAQRTG